MGGNALEARSQLNHLESGTAAVTDREFAGRAPLYPALAGSEGGVPDLKSGAGLFKAGRAGLAGRRRGVVRVGERAGETRGFGSGGARVTHLVEEEA